MNTATAPTAVIQASATAMPSYFDLLIIVGALAGISSSQPESGGAGHENLSRELLNLIMQARQALQDAPQPAAQPHSMWTASTYSSSSGEQGACVLAGEDTICDLPHGAGWTQEEANDHARRIALSVNACRGFDLDTLEAAPGLADGFSRLPGLARGNDADQVQELLYSALSALRDLEAGYPWGELHVDLETLLARAAAVGIVLEDQ